MTSTSVVSSRPRLVEIFDKRGDDGFEFLSLRLEGREDVRVVVPAPVIQK